MKKPAIIMITRAHDSFERSISNHKRAWRRLRNKRSPETLKEERSAFRQLKSHDLNSRAVAPAFSALRYISYLRGVMLRSGLN